VLILDIGAPGWKAFAEPILGKIDPTIGYDPSKPQIENISSTRSSYLLATSSELADALRRLGSLLSSHPNPGLSKRLLSRILLPIWSLASWPAEATELEEWRAPASYLLQVLLQLSSDGKALITISQNLLYTGNDDSKSLRWSYKLCPQGGIRIEKRTSGIFGDCAFEKPIVEQLLDRKVDALMAFMSPTADTDGVPKLFLSLCRKWLLAEDENLKPEIRLSASAQPEDTKELERKIIDAKIMQKMIDLLPSRLVEESNQVLELASEVLFKASRSTEDIDNDETVPIALSLLNMIFTASSTRTLSESQPIYTSIKQSLEIISRKCLEVSSTARNILMIMEFQANEPEFDEPARVQDKSIEDRKTYKLAMGYITGADSPAPVRAQGLDLLLNLIKSNSPILDVPATMILISSLLQDEEEYIYLRAIKAYIQLSIKHPKAVTKDVMERYFDANEELPLDARLRHGEALLQVIEKLGESFTGESAQHIGTGLLALAGRRGYRPKTEEKKQKAAALQKLKNKQAEDAWSGEVPQLDENEMTEDDILRAHIVEGWEGKRGEEDVRTRASALSIFGMAIEVNIAGLGSSLVSGGVDLSINILALEPEPEKGILRRSAILLVMSLIRALDKAQEEGKKLGFGLAGQSLDDVLRILKYVQETDNDGLVRQHAKDVVEELGVWQMKYLRGADIRTEMPQQVGLEELAGLSINPSRSRTTEPDLGGRPRIEEIE
jgi:hypothetical protein